MVDLRLPVGFSPEPATDKHPQYRIMRKGSRYNILGPEGRIFSKYQSAGTAGPRWEELTHTPWPYDSTAYERGQRLWELGLIGRTQIGKRNITLSGQPESVKPRTQPIKRRATKKRVVEPVTITIPSPLLALPAPKIDVAKQQRLMQALKRNPALLFNSEVQQALRHEVEYNRPQARWAVHLLKLLKRYERQQRSRRTKPANSAAILAKHTAWQAQRMQVAVG